MTDHTADLPAAAAAPPAEVKKSGRKPTGVLYVAPHLHELLKARAEREGKTIRAVLEDLIREAFEKAPGPKGRAADLPKGGTDAILKILAEVRANVRDLSAKHDVLARRVDDIEGRDGDPAPADPGPDHEAPDEPPPYDESEDPHR